MAANLSKMTRRPITQIISVVLHDGIHILTITDCCKEKPVIENKKDINLQKNKNKKKSDYLSVNIVQRMLKQLLTKPQMSKEKLAVALGITIAEFNRLCYKKPTAKLLYKINFALIKLYCGTKFND